MWIDIRRQSSPGSAASRGRVTDLAPVSTSVGDVLVPVLVAVQLAAGGLAVELEEALGHGAGATAADLAVVHLDEGYQLGGGAGEERLVRQVEVGAHERLLDDLVALVVRQRDDGVAGQSGEHA